jgi:hypothetical protein
MLRQIFICGVAACAFAAIPACAALVTISQPSKLYTSSTTLIDITGLTDGNTYGSIFGGGLTVTFNTALKRLTVPRTWGTWNLPPAVENAKPPVLFSNGSNDIVMSLSMPEAVFGFEAQPDLSGVEAMTATFFDAGMKSLGAIKLDVSGNGGALLFAASSSTKISSVELKNGAGDDFAIANVRFSTTPIPEPGSALLLTLAVVFLVGAKNRHGRSV